MSSGPDPDEGITSQSIISDGNHGGIAAFTFLPPIAPRPARFGANDDAAQPVVTIERRDSAGGTVGVFTRTSGPHGELVRLHQRGHHDEDNDHDDHVAFFVLRWKTRDFNVRANQIYRARVALPTGELGFADIQVVANAHQAHQVDRTRFAVVIAGEPLRIEFQIAPGASCAGIAFVSAVIGTTGPGPVELASADLDEDGVPDFISGDYNTGVGVHLSTGTGGVGPNVEYPSALGGILDIATGDFDGDAHIDVEVTNYTHQSIELFRGRGDGTLAPSVIIPTRSNVIHSTVGDANGDGILDVALANVDSTLDVQLGRGDGTFGAPTTYQLAETPFERPTQGVFADVSGDGRADLVVPDGGVVVAVLLGTGGGAFAPPVKYTVGNDPAHVAVGDFNHDGRPDLAVSNLNTSDVSILLNAGNGTFGLATSVPVGGAPQQLAVADFDGDDLADIAVPSIDTGRVDVLRGRGDGTFDAPVSLLSGAGASGVVAADVTGDGKPDLAAVSLYSDRFELFTNTCR